MHGSEYLERQPIWRDRQHERQHAMLCKRTELKDDLFACPRSGRRAPSLSLNKVWEVFVRGCLTSFSAIKEANRIMI